MVSPANPHCIPPRFARYLGHAFCGDTSLQNPQNHRRCPCPPERAVRAANRGKPQRPERAASEVTHSMSKQQKSNKEVRKPKKEKPKTNASNPSLKTGVHNVFDQRKK